MLDAEEIDAYNDWKASKLSGAMDLSVQAYNTEMESQAIAWEKGVKLVVDETPNIVAQQLADFLAKNPYRRPGMRGHTP